MKNLNSVTNLGQLRDLTKELPDSQVLYCQVVGSDEQSRGAWTMHLDFNLVERAVPPMAVFTVWHPELASLPEVSFDTKSSTPSSRNEVLEIDYVNHAGERSIRQVVPTGKIRFGTSPWHPQASWLMEAFCLTRNALREFDITKIIQSQVVR